MNQVTPARQQFGGYVLGEQIARGGQGAVHRARDSLGRSCALKLLQSQDPRTLKRFSQEGRVLAALSHPNLLRVTDLGMHQGTAFLAMEFVEGQDLEARVAARGVPEFAWSAKVLGAVAHALHYCHQQGLVHRDLKPANVVIEAGSERPVLVDFGMVQRDPERMRMTSLDGSALSKTGQLTGTPKYMAPEQASRKKFGEVSSRTDVYALGACLYFLLTGRPPVEGTSVVNVMANLMRGTPQDPRALNPDVPPALGALCMRTLSKEQSARPESAEAFAKELARLTGQEAWLPGFPSERPAPPPEGTPLGARDPQALGPYRILSALGKGGMGAVYVGRHEVLGAVRAVKVVQGLNDAHRRERFRREVAHLSGVRHPNVVAIHESGEVGSWAWYAMDIVGGQSLEALLEERGALSWRRASTIALGVAQGLGALHALGVVHRDIKPGNVVLREDGRPVVLDLGLAVAPELDERLTKTGAIVGTPYYLAPEQLSNAKAVDARADVHALGLLLFELVTGRRAVEAESIHMVLAAVLHETFPPPSQLAPGVPIELDRLCARCLEKDPADRPADGHALAKELEALLEAEPTARRRPAVLVAILVVVGLAVGLSIAGWAASADGGTNDVGATTDTQPPVSADEPTQSLPLTTGQIRAGDRAYARVEQIGVPREQAGAAASWIQTYTGRHPRAADMRALKEKAERDFAVRRIGGARNVRVVGETRFVTWASSTPRIDVLRLWDTEGTEQIAERLLPWAVNSATSAGGLLVVGGKGGDFLRLSAEDLSPQGAMLKTLRSGKLVLSPDGSRLAVASTVGPAAGCSIHLLDPRDGRTLVKGDLRFRGRLTDVAFSPDGSLLVVTAGTTPKDEMDTTRVGTRPIFVLDARTLEEVQRYEPPGRPNVVAFAPQGGTFAVGTISARLRLYDPSRPEAVRELQCEEGSTRVSVFAKSSAAERAIQGAVSSPDGARLFLATGEPDLRKGSLDEWDMTRGARLRSIDLGCVINLEITPDGRWLLLAYSGGGVELWRVH